MPDKQHHHLHECRIDTAWERDLFYSNMYPTNTTLKWLDTDTPENAQYEKDISYTFNEHGFRSDSFSLVSDINILVSGCSLTVGVGVAEHEAWPFVLRGLITEEVGCSTSLWNIATAGASPDYVARSIYKIDEVLHPDMIFVVWPSDVRFEMPSAVDENKLTQAKAYEDNFPKRLMNTDWLHYNLHKNVAFMDERHRRKLKYYKSNIDHYKRSVADQIKFEEAFRSDTQGRDRMHPGPDWHSRVAHYFFDHFISNKEHLLKRFEKLRNLKLR